MVLLLDGNRFKGDIDSAGFQGLPNIDALRVEGNDFTGDAIKVCRSGMSRFVSDCGSAPGKSDGEVRLSIMWVFLAHCSNSSSAMTRSIETIQVMCRCCTACCLGDEGEDAACGDLGWDVAPDGMWEHGYSRVSWEFDDSAVAPL